MAFRALFLAAIFTAAAARAHVLRGDSHNHERDLLAGVGIGNHHGHVHPEIRELRGHDGADAPTTFQCGVGDPRLQQWVDESPANDVQNYVDTSHPDVARHLKERGGAGKLGPLAREVHGRHLQSQDYGGAFVSAEAAAEMEAEDPSLNLLDGIRITAVWDPVEESDYPYTCRVGGSATVFNPALGQTYACTEAEHITPELLELMKRRTEYAVNFFRDALKIKPVLDDIRVNNGDYTGFRLQEQTYSNTDLVLIMTATPAEGLNGYARCRQYDQYGRCTVGEFNWVPTYLDPSTIDDLDAINANRHTALHEIVHVLGGIGPSVVFRNEDGTQASHSTNWINALESEGYPKMSTKLKSPRVLAWAREHYACDELDGLALEDQVTGAKAHWEARILGPELMSYGTGTGETIFGDVTFAYLEDTRQYVANYTQAGRLVKSQEDTGQDLEWEIAFDRAEDFEPPFVRPPGFLRWGYNKTCSFVQGNARDWDEPYKCMVNKVFDCTHDYRMSGVCAIAQYQAFANDQFSCGYCPEPRCSKDCTHTKNDSPIPSGGYALPTMYQYFDETTAREALGSSVPHQLVGGFSSAMDFVPVRLGYWNCQDAKAATNETGAGNEGGGLSVSSLLGGSETDEMKLFGGQAYCPDCRCMKSSLMDFTAGTVDTDFTTYGLCYRTNCASTDTLQFAIESQTGGETKWYGCPKGGGKLYIAGFSGSMRCPNPEEFCQYEKITGITYKTTDPFWEWVFLGSVAALPLLIALCCIPPCTRNYCIGRLKKWCGVNHFTKEGKLDLDGEIDSDTEETAPPAGPGRVLKCINGLIFLCALIMLVMILAGLAKPSIAAIFLGFLAASTMLFAFMGYMAGVDKARGVSCAPMIYLYVVFFACVFWIFSVLYAVAYPEALSRVLDRQWPMIANAFPEGVLAKTLNEGEAEKIIEDNMEKIVAFYLGLGIVLAIQLIAVMKIVTLPIVASSFYTVCNWMILIFGLGQWAAAAYVSRLSETLPGASNVIGGFAVMGAWWVGSAIFAIVASHKKTVSFLGLAMGVTVLSVLLTLSLSAVVFLAVQNVDSLLEEVSDDDLAKTTEALGLDNGSREDIAEGVRNNLRTLGLAGICAMLCMLILLVSNAFFLHKVRLYWKAERPRRARKPNQVQPF